MAKRHHHRGRGARGGTDSASFRGRGGGGPGGRGRGAPGAWRTPGSSFLPEELGFTIQMYADSPNSPAPAPTSGRATPREGIGLPRGRGRGGGYIPTAPHTGDRNHRGWNHFPRGSFNSPQSGSPRGRGRGRGRGQEEASQVPSRRGRGLGAGIGIPPPRIGPNATLSDLLFESRPLLRPIHFIPSVLSPFLFQEEEDILQATIEEVGDDEASHVPTADRITRIFSGVSGPRTSSASPSEAGVELEEIDFNDTAKLLEPGFKGKANISKPSIETGEDQSSEVATPSKHRSAFPSIGPPSSDGATSSTKVNVPSSTTGKLIGSAWPEVIPPSLGLPEPQPPAEDEEIIVYVAPHPKVRGHPTPGPETKDDSLPEPEAGAETEDTSRFEPYVSPPTLSLALMAINEPTLSEPAAAASPSGAPLLSSTVKSLKFQFSGKEAETPVSGRKLPGVVTPRMAKTLKGWERKKAKWERARGKKRRSSGRFAALGALRREAQLHGDAQGDELSGDDPRYDERRRGNSDVEWGTESEGASGDLGSEGEVDGPTAMSAKAKGKQKARPEEEELDNHGMEVDSELDMDVAAMKRFVSGLMGPGAQTFTTMDDVAVEEKIKSEDMEGLGGAEGSSDGASTESEDVEVEHILKLEEKMWVGEDEDSLSSEDEDEIEEDDSDDDENDFSPNTSFQARLKKLRAQTRGGKHVDAFTEDEDEDDDMLERNMAWAEEDDLINRIEELLDENSDIIDDRRTRNRVFRAVQNGDFADMQPAKKGRARYKDFPEDLQHLWEKDRQKKAERKRVRELEKLIQATDPFSKKKGGKKGRKAMLAAARLDPTINVLPNRIIDITTLVQQIRRFVADLGGPGSMSLPPTDKTTRKNVHELALAFGLKSQSKGRGEARYTTLYKTTKTGQVVDERKVARIMRRKGDFVADKEWRRAPKVPKHREGDEVGAAAPKLGESNVGFRMLALMGWKEGNQIGLSGGLDAPLVAIVKHSKLGLGATK